MTQVEIDAAIARGKVKADLLDGLKRKLIEALVGLRRELPAKHFDALVAGAVMHVAATAAGFEDREDGA